MKNFPRTFLKVMKITPSTSGRKRGTGTFRYAGFRFMQTGVLLALILLPGLAAAETATADTTAYVTLNEDGGTASGDGLKIYAGTTGMFQVVREGNSQFYYSGSVPPSTNFGQMLAVGGTTYGPFTTRLTAASQSLSGSGTEDDPYIAITKMTAGSTGVTLRQELRYTAPNDYVKFIVDVIPPSDNTETIKLYMGGDTYLSGGDNGGAYYDPASGTTKQIVGVTKDTYYMVFIQGSDAFDDYYSGYYYYAESQPSDGGDYDDTLTEAETTDNGMGVEWNLGAITETTRITYYMSFSDVDSTCGDGTIEGIEVCDDGNTVSGDGCSSACVVESDYSCADEPSVCTEIVCGDGAVDGSESCDDGNTIDGDGCSSSCVVESDYTCTGEPSDCSICGDGTVGGDESCDDGNTSDGDGCSSSCEIESGYICSGTPSVCSICGNDTVDGNEACDDGNTSDGDGCSSSCEVEDGYTCSGEPSTCKVGEEGKFPWPLFVPGLTAGGR